MYKDLLNKLKEGKENSKANKQDITKDEEKLDKLAEYLIAKFNYDKENIKEILRGASDNKFSINLTADRNLLINTLLDVIVLEITNKYNNLFITLAINSAGAPLAVITDLVKISLNTDAELSAFITSEEMLAVNSYNEEVDYVNNNISS